MTDSVGNCDDYNDIADVRVVVVPDSQAGERLDAALAAMLPEYSRSRLTQWIRDGFVRLDGKPTAPKTKVYAGQSVEVEEQLLPEDASYVAEDIFFPIVYEDEHILVVDKPAGLVTHPGSGNWTGTLLNGLLHHAPGLRQVPRAGIVHRLDKDTSGLMVVAKTVPAQLNLIKQLQARTVKRHYRAIACGIVGAERTVDAPIGRDPKNRIKMAVVYTGKPAITHVRPLEAFEHHTLVECRLETGRTHQIRVHMAYIKHPLAADPVYGNPRMPATPEVRDALEAFGRQALHAFRLSLTHPATGETMSWQARTPNDMRELLTVLRGAMPDDDLDDEDWDDEDDNGWEVIYERGGE